MKMRVVDDVVVDMSEEPGAAFHPSIAAEFVDVPKNAPAALAIGWRKNGRTWSEPAPVIQQPAPEERG